MSVCQLMWIHNIWGGSKKLPTPSNRSMKVILEKENRVYMLQIVKYLEFDKTEH